MTALMYASLGGHVECVKALVMAKADINDVDEDGMSPLHFAATGSHFEACQILVNGGAERFGYDGDNRTPFDCLSQDCQKLTADKKKWRALLLDDRADDFTDRQNPLSVLREENS